MRLFLFQVIYVFQSFNPRICKRCDQAGARALEGIQVSIHASVKDATQTICNGYFSTDVSIHASVKDATKWGGLQFLSIDVSIHASVKDATG